MRNPWRMQDGPDNQINRNNFPMSFQYNGTFKYGKIYPIGLWRTIPGASYQIDSTLALNFMPTAFPIQTRQRAYVHFFYGRDRNFWKDYKDFVNGMNPDLVKPYIDESVTKARTGNLLDYLGVPTTFVGNYARFDEYDLTYSDSSSSLKKPFLSNHPTFTVRTSNASAYVYWPYADDVESQLTNYRYSNIYEWNDNPTNVASVWKVLFDSPTNVKRFRFNVVFSEPLGTDVNTWLSSGEPAEGTYFPDYYAPRKDMFALLLFDAEHNVLGHFLSPTLSNQGQLEFVCNVDNVSEICILQVNNVRTLTPSGDVYQSFQYITSNSFVVYPNKAFVETFNESDYGTVRDIDDDTTPYWGSGHETDLRKRIKLSAIPCRFYETVYNLYYRNPQNNPYILNGKPEYNIFIPTKDGGADYNLYELRYRNWEDDFLTTAVQTPQQGIAPLVGLTDRGATVTLTNEDGSVTRYKTTLDENGNVTGVETTDSSEPLLTQALIDAVSYGISIEDLRNVNAMQKWLELNLRKGYQYKDIIESRWGISISYNELDLPEFIGGFTQEVGLQAVTQTTSHGEGIEGALGWQAGRMYAAGSGRQITHYCDEEGYIMALLCVVPVPNYSQLLPKHWFTRDLLDSYQPEFNHIGFQPITYKEVCPIQAFQESTENVDVLEQTFGYQRPWYEYFNQVDEVHGQFRTTFKDFLINRTFNVKPELSESFLLVDPNQVNDVFAVQTDDDKIIGAIEHRITAKLPISLYAQARLE